MTDRPTEPRDVLYKRHRFPAEIISHAIWLYFRFPLSLRHVEDLLAERGIEVSFQTVAEWAGKFGGEYARRFRRRSKGGLAAIINAAGWVWVLYRPVWGYDEVAHFFTTFAVTLAVGYLVLYGVSEHFRDHRLHYFVVVTSFGVTLGAWWEVIEFFLLKQLNDPVGDIIVDSLGALMAGGLAAWTLTREAPGPAKRNRKGAEDSPAVR